MSTETASVLFTDLVASTELRQALGEERADTFRRTHDQLLTAAVEAVGGRVVKGLGDGIMAVFSAAADAVEAAVAIQRAASAHGRQQPDEAFKVRIGISVGDVSLEDDDYFGTAVVEASRLCDAAQGEQILVADLVRALARGRGSHSFESMGELDLKGLDAPVAACFVNWEPPSAVDAARVPFPSLLAPTTGSYAGRLGLLADLSKAWDVASDGSLRLVLLSGEPGVGKTRTASEIARRAHEDGALVLYGRCDEELALPYEPFVEALDHQTAHDPALPLGRFPGDLRRLLPDLDMRVPDLPPAINSDPRAEEHRLLEATASWLSATASDPGLLLVIDDLHWATRPTLLMLMHVGRVLASTEHARSLIVATYRDTDLDRAHPLFSTLGDLRRLPGVERLSVDPLTEGEVMDLIADLAGHDLDDAIRELARRTHAETEGNPYFVGEVLRHFIETGVVRFEDGRWHVTDSAVTDVPEGVRDVIGRRLNRLSETANDLLRTAAVIGREFSLDVVSDAAGLDTDAALDALDEAIRARLVEEIGLDRFRFAHALTREALYEELSSIRRRRVHRQVVGALEQHRPNDHSSLAHHSIEAGPIGGDLSGAIVYSILAGQAAIELRAVADARHHFEAALEMLSHADEPDVTSEITARLGLGEAQRDSGDPAFRETLLAVTGNALASGNIELAARAAMANSRGFDSMIGATDEERVEKLEAVLAVHEGDGAERALLQARLASELSSKPGSLDRRVRLADDARAAALASGDELLIARVFAATSNASNVPDRLERVTEETRRLREAAELAGDPTIRVLARTLDAYLHAFAGGFDEHRALLDEAAEIAEDQASPSAAWMVECFRTQHDGWDGDLQAAQERATASLERGLALGEPDTMSWYGASQVGIWWTRRETDAMIPVIDELVRQYPELGGWRMFRAFVDVMAGDLEGARRRADEEHVADPATIEHDMFTVPVWAFQSEICFALGLAEESQALLDRLQAHEHRWAQYGTWVFEPVALALARCHATVGNLTEADGLARRAWQQLSSSPVQCIVPAGAAATARVLMAVGGTEPSSRAMAIVDEGRRAAERMELPLRVAELDALAEALQGS